ncbi:DUF4381 family protein, partial [Hansschlegelia beijingensis]|uniref:DUF4381 family protein n=1 Tax=Hansschlegelia beijingensis TaxID=1133344 RepID=UPI00387F0F7E
GAYLRAATENPTLVGAFGVNVPLLITLTYAFGVGLAAQAALLRRVVRTVDGDEAARREGPAWGETLDRVLRTDFFTSGAGRVFATGLYVRPDDTGDAEGEIDRRLATLLSGLRR